MKQDTTQDMKKETIINRIAERVVRNERTAVRTAAYSSTLTCVQRLIMNKMKKNILQNTDNLLVNTLRFTFCGTWMRLRYELVVLMALIFGASEAWGQDYSGTYYIANKSGYNSESINNNYYLIPAENCNYGDESKPHLTTDKTNQSSESIWRIKKDEDTDFYYIIYVEGENEKYLTANSSYAGTTGNNVGRLRVHLESKSTLDNDNLFQIKSNSNGGFNIRHKDMNDKINNGTVTYLDPAGGNRDGKEATSYRTMETNTGTVNVGGTIGYWTDEVAARWIFETTEPALYFDSNGSKITVSGGGEVFYTIDETDPAISSTTPGDVGNVSTKKLSVDPILIEGDDPILIKFIATSKDGYTIKSPNIVYFVYNPEMDLDETSFVYNGTAQSPHITSSSITINGAEKPISDFVIGAKNNVNAGTATLTLWDKDNGIYVEKPFTINPLNATLDWVSTELEYSGTSQVPSVEITNLIDGDDCNVIIQGAQTDLSLPGEEYSATIIGLAGTDKNNYVLPTDESLLIKSFTIIQKSLGLDDGTTPAKGISVTLNDGDPVTITVEHEGNPNSPLTQGRDYNVSGPEDDGGDLVWTISGIGNYKGTMVVKRFRLSFDETGEALGAEMHDVTPYKAFSDMEITYNVGDDTKHLNVYIVTHINMTKHTLTIKKLNYVPKDEPVLLLTDLEGTVTNFTATSLYVAEDDAVDTSDNLLQKTETDEMVGFGERYMYVDGVFVMTTGGKMPSNSFYLNNPTPPGTPSNVSGARLRIAIDDMTDVKDARFKLEDVKEDYWYAVDGRRFSVKPTQKGLYIWNGHKVVIK